MRILLSNDDGINAEGLKVVREILSQIADVYVVAPQKEKSGCSHSLTITNPLMIKEHEQNVFSIDGTPADCVKIGVEHLFRNKVDLVISGINDGANVGEDIFYSGTVAAAREACINNLPAIAYSIDGYGEKKNFGNVGKYIIQITKTVFEKKIPQGVLLNVNFPNFNNDQLFKGIKITTMGKRKYSDNIVERVNPNGKRYFWIGWEKPQNILLEDTDNKAITDGYISITPLGLDVTVHNMISFFKEWNFNNHK